VLLDLKPKRDEYRKATEVIAGKASAKWTYKSNQGYMPMVGHIAQTGQSEEIISDGSIYRAIATHRDTLTDSQIIHWYNQREKTVKTASKNSNWTLGVIPCSVQTKMPMLCILL